MGPAGDRDRSTGTADTAEAPGGALLDQPGESFHRVGIDPGIAWEKRPAWMLRRVPGARVRQIACSEHAEIQARMERNLEPGWDDPDRVVVFETNTVRARASGLALRSGSIKVRQRWLLNGASGDRLLGRYLKQEAPHPQRIRRLNRFFLDRAAEARLDLPEAGPAPAGVPAVIECRNLRNYYHFMAETLPQLVHFLHHPPDRIIIHSRGAVASEGFAKRFIDALFPELAPRIELHDQALRLDEGVIALNARHLLYANGDPLLTETRREAAAIQSGWAQARPQVRGRKFVFKHTTDVSLRLLRERALALIAPSLTERLPRRIFVSRDYAQGSANHRPMEGHEELARDLIASGFAVVHFERLSPLEQIAQMHAADVVVADHGAFFANMMFARPEAHVLEIGSLQTQLHRWGDFLPNAHASGCRYTTVFADVATGGPEAYVAIAGGLRGVRVSPACRSLILRTVDAG